jgi:hypothetical protein
VTARKIGPQTENRERQGNGYDAVRRPRHSIQDAPLGQLASLLEQGTPAERIWEAEELGAILRHQMSAPLRVDLVSLERGQAAKVRVLAESQGLILKSFGDLLAHRHPPLELLVMAKDFAKASRISPESAIPREVASVLYFASIVAAMTRCRVRISRLKNRELRAGIRWALAQAWLDEPTRALFQEGLGSLDAADGGGR